MTHRWFTLHCTLQGPKDVIQAMMLNINFFGLFCFVFQNA